MPTPTETQRQSTRAKSLLTDPFKRKQRMQDFVSAIAEYGEDFEGYVFDTLTKIILGPDAPTAVLDEWGDNLGLLRDGRDNTEYLSDLRGWNVFLRSKGRPEQLYLLLHLLAFTEDDYWEEMQLYEWPPALVCLAFNAIVTDSLMLVNRMDRAAGAGVKVVLVHYDYTQNVFRFDTPGQGFDEGEFAELL